MKIAVSGTQCIGKSTFVDDFKDKWSMYKSPARTYRDVIREKKLEINQLGTEESQRAILNALVDEVTEAKSDEHIIFNRCVLDNLVYTMFLNAMEKVPDKFVKETIDIVRETLVFFDIVFFCPITKLSPVNIQQAEQRDIDPQFRDTVDVFFKSLMNAYNKHSTVYFPFDHDLGCPAIIEIFGSPEERIQLAQFYINDKGDIYGEDDTLIDPNNLDETGLELAREVFGVGKPEIVTP